MPRRLPHDHDEMRARAVAAARADVVADGLAGLTARRIAGALGCSVGSLYNLFVDLDDLVLHVAATVVDDMHHALFDAPLSADPAEALAELALRYVRFAAEQGHLFAMVFEHVPGHERPTPRWHLDRIERLVDAVRAVAAPALAARGGGDPRLDVEVLWAAVHGIATLAQKDKLGFVATTTPEVLVRRLIFTFLHRVES